MGACCTVEALPQAVRDQTPTPTRLPRPIPAPVGPAACRVRSNCFQRPFRASPPVTRARQERSRPRTALPQGRQPPADLRLQCRHDAGPRQPGAAAPHRGCDSRGSLSRNLPRFCGPGALIRAAPTSTQALASMPSAWRACAPSRSRCGPQRAPFRPAPSDRSAARARRAATADSPTACSRPPHPPPPLPAGRRRQGAACDDLGRARRRQGHAVRAHRGQGAARASRGCRRQLSSLTSRPT